MTRWEVVRLWGRFVEGQKALQALAQAGYGMNDAAEASAAFYAQTIDERLVESGLGRWATAKEGETGAACKHESVDELLIEWRGRFRSYREACLDCGAERVRIGRCLGKWSPWASPSAAKEGETDGD